MGGAVWGGHSLAIGWLGQSLFGEIIALGGAIFLGVAVYLAIIVPLKIPEFHYLLDELRSRWSRRKAD
jgi:hypothetical protein